jgi:hypothetical protein
MKGKIRILIRSALIVLQSIPAISQDVTMMPYPRNVTFGPKQFLIKNAVIILPENSSSENRFAVHQLQQFIKEGTGAEMKIIPAPAQKQQRTIHFSVTTDMPALPVPHEKAGRESREAFWISVNENEIRIRANSSAGVYYAVQTLRQLVHHNGANIYIPEMELEDYPYIAYRAVMMDFSHGGLLTVEEIKRQIDYLARFRVNQYGFYNEVSIELDGYAALNYRAGYSRDQIKSIIDYARQRHMDVIPFVNFYGHLHELLRNEKYKLLGIGKYGHELDPRNPKVKSMLRDWIKQYTSLFQSPFVHVGFDETWETKRISASLGPDFNGEQVYIDHLNFVNEEFKKYGKLVMAWTDITNFYPGILAKLPKDLIPVIWEYSPDSDAINHFLKPALECYHTFMIQPAVSGWGQIYPSGKYTFDNMNLCLKIGLENKTSGYITSLWTDAVEPFVRPSWMFTSYGSTIAWQGKPIEPDQFIDAWVTRIFPVNAEKMRKVFCKLDSSENYLERCLGRTQTGSIVEKWSNPFLPNYLRNTSAHMNDFANSRRLSEEAEDLLIQVMRTSPEDSIYVNSLLVSARMLHYTASRFIYARAIVDRWNDAIQIEKNDIFLTYDIAYTCHGMLVDAMDDNGELKNAYSKQWLDEFMPFRLNTMLSRFDVEAGLWRKLYLKFLDFDVQSKENNSGLAAGSFEDVFHPDY